MRFFRPVPRLTLAQAEDASAVAALLALAGVAGTAPAPDAGEVGAWLRGGFEVYKASLDGKLVGCIRCAFPTGACVIDQIAVVPAERGRGFGEYLLEQAISRARRAGAARAWIHLPAACEAPINLARKLGFREAARHQLAASGEPVVLLELVL